MNQLGKNYGIQQVKLSDHEIARRADIHSIINDPGLTRKVRRALLRDKYGFSEEFLDELFPLKMEADY